MNRKEPDSPFAKREESARIPRHADSSGKSVGALTRVLRQAAPFMSAAWVMTGGLLGGTLGGRWLDQWLDSKPLFLVVGLVLGLVLGMYEVARVALKSGKGRS